MPENKPLILVSNDDGITAPGVRVLIRLMNQLGEVVVVAPDSPQSGTGHAITLNDTLRCDRFYFDDGPQTEYACSGTPVDCVKLAVNVILPRKPDLLVSGINHGSNASINVIYSGTMSAAMEGCLEGIPSVGFSLDDHSMDADFSQGESFILDVAGQLLKRGLPEGVCLNVNIPRVGRDTYKGIRVCRQANANWVEEFDSRTDPKGRGYYWLTGHFENYDHGDDTDLWAVANNFISVVPVSSDITAHHAISILNTWDFE